MLTIQEHTSSKYTPRTYYNAKAAQITLAFAIDFSTAGERLTKKASDVLLELPLDTPWIENARKVYRALVSNQFSIINVAGNGIYTLNKHGITQKFVDDYVYSVLRIVNIHRPITKIYSGGQTGADLAGARAGWKLQIDTEVTYPKGYIMRWEDGKDKPHTKEYIEKLIEG